MRKWLIFAGKVAAFVAGTFLSFIVVKGDLPVAGLVFGCVVLLWHWKPGEKFDLPRGFLFLGSSILIAKLVLDLILASPAARAFSKSPPGLSFPGADTLLLFGSPFLGTALLAAAHAVFLGASWRRVAIAVPAVWSGWLLTFLSQQYIRSIIPPIPPGHWLTNPIILFFGVMFTLAPWQGLYLIFLFGRWPFWKASSEQASAARGAAPGSPAAPAVTPEPRKPKPLFRASGVVVPALFILLVGGGWVAYQYWWLPRPQKAVELRDAEQLTAQALRYKEQREFEKSETHFKRALAIREKALGAEHLDVAKSLHELALNYMAQRKYAEAEPLLRRVLAIREKRLGPDHLLIVLTLDNLAFTSQVRGNWGEASALSTRAREMRERLAGRR